MKHIVTVFTLRDWIFVGILALALGLMVAAFVIDWANSAIRNISNWWHR